LRTFGSFSARPGGRSRLLIRESYFPREVFFGRFGFAFPADPSGVFAGDSCDFFLAIADSLRSQIPCLAHATRPTPTRADDPVLG
jgi:hypothetical protein